MLPAACTAATETALSYFGMHITADAVQMSFALREQN